MEENIAILIADLSGYTALTETHGAEAAADLIDKYMGMVNDCLVGDCRLHARVGDEVVIVSRSPDHLMSTSVMLIQKSISEKNFLQVHGGLHFGTILTRNGQYFGTTINLASRIASRANPGTFWCSAEFVTSLKNSSDFKLMSKGMHSFKNLTDEKEVLELIVEDVGTYHIDPVCRMLLNESESIFPHPVEADIFFCSQHCYDIYNRSNNI